MRSDLAGTVALLLALPLCAWAAEPIAHWSMDAAAEGVVADLTGNGHEATFFSTGGDQPKLVPGIAGSAVELSEELEQGFTVAKSEAFSFAGPFTVMAWVRPTRRGAAFEVCCLKGDKSGEPPWPGWRLRYFWARMMLQVGTPEGTEPSVSTAEWTVPEDYWSHIAATWDGKMLRAYVNAVEKACTPFEGAIAPQRKWYPLVLGNYIGRKNAYAFDGLIDEVVLLDTALTEDEIFAWASRGTD